ncbi:hypothetical protein [Bartonella sp. AU18XJBT]|uniref:hypothetical protein n=1 Tax=Bartonella sp. AU18XJBT TaxID=3019089 RepID=UPI002360243F|nr:hypothetical protein [Bartonella sp. AU18XJBT]
MLLVLRLCAGDVGNGITGVLRRHYGCVSGGMRGEVGRVTYMLVNGMLRRHCWRGRGWRGA